MKKKFEDCKESMKKEILVHENIAKFMRISMEEYKEDIEMWKKRYVEEKERKGVEVEEMRVKLAEMKESLKDLRSRYAGRQKEIEDYLEYKEEKKRKAEELARLNKEATKIQAWWRGTMVRRGLGPYKKKKPKGKAAKSGK